MAVVEDIKSALKELNGSGKLSEIYDHYLLINKNAVYSSMKRTLQQYSSDSTVFLNRGDYFFSVEGIGNGVWGLRNHYVQLDVEETPNDGNNNVVERRSTTYERIIRDTVLSRTVKELVGNRCQLCNTDILLHDGSFYSEAHHIRPLGRPHNGPDNKNNIIVLCPNCHAKCDLNTIELNLVLILRNFQDISQTYINYHNAEYRRKSEE